MRNMSASQRELPKAASGERPIVSIIAFDLPGPEGTRMSRSVMTPPLTSPKTINRFNFEKETGTKNKGNQNEQLIALDQIAEDMIKGQNNAKPEFSSFKYLILDLNKDKNKEANYDTDISGSYVYAKYFMKVEPKEKVNEQKLLDQAILVIKSNHASKDVANLKALIEKLYTIETR